MRSSNWEYLGSVLVGAGAALSISGLVTFFYFQAHSMTRPQYSSYPMPLLIAGICVIVGGAIALLRSRTRKRREAIEAMMPPIPPAPPPPPPP